MTNMTLSMPEKVHEKMMEHSEIKWSEVARLAIRKKIEDLEMMDKLTSKSKLTKTDVKEISELVDNDVAKRLNIK